MRVRQSAVVLLIVLSIMLLGSCQLGGSRSAAPALGSAPPPPPPSSPPPPPAVAPMQVLYVLQNYIFVSTYHVDMSTGVPTVVGGPHPFDEPSRWVLQLTPSPDGHFLYVQCSDALHHRRLSLRLTAS